MLLRPLCTAGNPSDIISSSTRFVVTFETNALAVSASVLDFKPLNSTVVKQYSRRLVLDLGRPIDVDYDSGVIDNFFVNLNMTLVSIEPDLLISSVIAQQMPVTGTEWQYLDVEPYSLQMESVWYNFSLTGSPNVTVASLDGGLALEAYNHLFSNLVSGYDFISDLTISLDGDGRDAQPIDLGYSQTSGCPPPFHGTMTAALISGRYDAVPGIRSMQPDAALLPVRVLGACGVGYANDVADAIIWAVGGDINGLQNNPIPAVVVSMSFVGQGECPSYLQSAVTIAVTRFGAILVAAAGNDADDAGNYFPANCLGVVPVGASTRQGALAGYSNSGNLLLASAPGGDSDDPIFTCTVEDDRLVPITGYGSSFSAAFVSGMFALKLSVPSLRTSISRLFYANECIQFNPDSHCQPARCGPGIESGIRLITGSHTPVWGLDVNFSTIAGNASQSTQAKVQASVFYTMGALGGICLPGTMSTSVNSTQCIGCSAGTFGSGVGLTVCTACYNGTYASASSTVWCPLCPAGKYGTATNQTICVQCSPGLYSSMLGATGSAACTQCSAGTYSSANGAAWQCNPPNLTWLFKSPLTGFYYLTLPVQQAASHFYSPTKTLTYWNKVRINSTLSNQMNVMLLYVQAMNRTYQVPNVGVINSNTGPCLDTVSQFDATYAQVPSDTTTFTDFGSAGSCGWSVGSTRTYLVGTPFGIRDTVQAYTGPGCSWSYTFTFTCAGIQDCTTTIAGNCGGSEFMGVLSIINVTQFQSDVNQTCALYPYDPPTLLSCSKTETVNYTCASNPCQGCQAGSYGSSAGLSVCLQCPVGKYSTGTNSAVCTNCSAGSYGTRTGANSSSACSSCRAGTFSENSSSACSSCQAGTFSVDSSSACSLCQAGTFSANPSPACTLCQAGTFSDISGLSSCKTCTQCGFAQINLSPCQVGGVSDTTNCTCGVNSYGTTSCTVCPPNTVAPQGSQTALACRCLAGYTCSYTKTLTLTLYLNLTNTVTPTDPSGLLNSQLMATVALAAGVPITSINIGSISPVPQNRRSLKKSTHLVTVYLEHIASDHAMALRANGHELEWVDTVRVTRK